MNKVCIIPARGGSKRIPHKNIRDFLGKPIISYAIDAALGSGIFDEVMVSTDDADIAEISCGLGASVPFLRSAESSDDYATVADVLIEVLDCYEDAGTVFDWTCCLYATAPFVTAQKLKTAWESIGSADSLIAVSPFSFPPQRGFIQRDGFVNWWMPEYANSRSQDIPHIYHDAGQFGFVRSNSLRERRCIVGSGTRAYLLSELEVQDIDNLSDWAIAEQKYRCMKAEVTENGF